MLVERIINKIINQKIDIDKLLIVTFTNAAAAEMRQRILEALYAKIEGNPENENLQRQIILLNKANISTIHAFCLEVIKNYFYEINISSNFRIGDTQEIELLKQETLEEVFENLYEENSEDFINLVNTYGGYRDDIDLKELVLKIYNYSQSMPFPEEWINEAIEKFNLKDKIDQDFANTEWGQILVEYFKQEIISCIDELEKASEKLKYELELERYYSVILEDIQNLKVLLKEENTWDDLYGDLCVLKFATWPRQAKTDCDLKEKCKEIRDGVKDRIKALAKRIFIYSSKEANEDIYNMYVTLKTLEKVILEFSKKYQENKKEKNIIDFNDIEHFALKILVKKDDNGNYIPTEVANNYKEKFVEIAIDEYQDSNLVQEYILTTISNNNNIFMVGDVKQSIYKFRQARPELFLEKYDNYILTEDNKELCQEDTKIQLFQNFRSRKNVLDLTNVIFNNIMSKKLGDIDYNKSEYLNAAANYIKPENNENVAGKVELDIIDLAEEDNVGVDASVDPQQNETEELLLEKSEIEAKFVANRIKKLFEENYYVFDKKQGYRKLKYKDIVILLRTTSNIANLYEKELNKLEIPVFSDTSSSYFETEEIQIILALLKIIDNPNNDIPLATVLRSMIGGFTDNELIEIRLNSKDTSFYEAMLNMLENEEQASIKEKVKNFLNTLEQWGQKQEYLSLDEFIWYLYETTGFYDYISTSHNGDLKVANLKLLFEKAKDYEKASFKGLYNFINYVDKISKSSGDAGSAKLIGENEDVIRIMSIHKSKGLEFPIVFLSETGKKFNLQDLNESILMHQKLGFGPKRINYKKLIEYNTLAKEALKNVIKDETISEEMRVLYVALTRSKEKLIITGRVPNLLKAQKEKEELIKMNNGKITPFILKKYKSYLDWFMLVYLNDRKELENILEINEYKIKDIIKKEENIEKEKIDIRSLISKDINNKEIDKIKENLDWIYTNKEATKFISKTSVSELKKVELEEREIYEKINLEPQFLSKEKTYLTGAEKGTLMHLILQKIDFKKEQNIQGLLKELLENNIIDELEFKNVQIQKIEKFLQSNLVKRMKTAKEIHKEEPFYINLEAKEIYDTNLKDEILVQGVIDLYFIDEENKLVLVDYKTDKVEKEEELAQKYQGQLRLYKKALENATSRKVDEVYIYSIHSEKEIDVAKLCKL